jgi:hypothetical protein
MQNYRTWLSAAFVAVCFICGHQASGTHQASKSGDHADVTNLLDGKIKEEWEAIKNKNQKAYGELLTDDYVAVESDGNGERYKWKALSELQQSLVADYTLSFLKVSTLCPDTALVRYEVFIKFPPQSTVKFEKILVGEVWVKRDDRWKALHYQETRVK